MADNPSKIKSLKSVWTHIRVVRRRIRAARPPSFYLIFAIILMLLVGSQMTYVREDPKRFALFLVLHFIFFLVVLMLAVIDFMKILREYLKEPESLYRTTLGEKEFVDELGRRVTERKDL